MDPTIIRLPKNGEVWELQRSKFLIVSADASEPSPFQILRLQSQEDGTIHEILLADFLSDEFRPEQYA